MAGGVPYQQIVFPFETGNLFVKQPMVSGQPRQKNQGDGFGAAVTIHPVMNLAAGRCVELFLHGCHLLRFLLSLYSRAGKSTAPSILFIVNQRRNCAVHASGAFSCIVPPRTV